MEERTGLKLPWLKEEASAAEAEESEDYSGLVGSKLIATLIMIVALILLGALFYLPTLFLHPTE